MLEKVPFLPSTKECSKVEIVLVLVPALSYQAYSPPLLRSATNQRCNELNSAYHLEKLKVDNNRTARHQLPGSTASTSASSRSSTPSAIVPQGSQSQRSRQASRHTDKRQRKVKIRSPVATALLQEWVDKHRAHPYPSKEEKEKLLLETGMTPRQLQVG